MLLEEFGKVISDPMYILAIILASIGVACALLAKRMTKFIRKTEDVQPSDKILVGMKLAGLVLILAGFVLLMIGGLTRLG